MEYRICFKSVKPFCVYVGLRKGTYFKAFLAFGRAGVSQENQRSARGAKGSKRMILCLAGHRQMGAGALRCSAHRGATHASPALPWTSQVGPHGPLQGQQHFLPLQLSSGQQRSRCMCCFLFYRPRHADGDREKAQKGSGLGEASALQGVSGEEDEELHIPGLSSLPVWACSCPGRRAGETTGEGATPEQTPYQNTQELTGLSIRLRKGEEWSKLGFCQRTVPTDAFAWKSFQVHSCAYCMQSLN